MEKTKTRIIWNGQGGELDSVVVKHSADDTDSVRKAFEKLIAGTVVNAGDSFIVQEVE
jgi:hypothetical protein